LDSLVWIFFESLLSCLEITDGREHQQLASGRLPFCCAGRRATQIIVDDLDLAEAERSQFLLHRVL
jgi:hypothetical protein